MLSVRLPLAIIITAILAVLGYIAHTLDQSGLLASFGFPLGAIVGFVLLYLASSLVNGSAERSTPRKKAIPSSPAGSTTLYVGNLAYKANEQAVQALFEQFGQVQSVRLMKDKRTGKRKGFGFVEIADADANNAIKQLNDSEFMERTLKVRPAKEKPE